MGYVTININGLVFCWWMVKKFFLYIILKPCTEFLLPTVRATIQKVCVGVVWWLKPILVFSLIPAGRSVFGGVEIEVEFCVFLVGGWGGLINVQEILSLYHP